MIINLLKLFSSLKLTVVLLLLLLVSVIVTYNLDLSFRYSLILPLALLVINLLAAIVIHPAFRASMPLLGFYLCLLATVVLTALSQLTYLEGHVEIGEGELFNGQLSGVKQGPLHRYSLSPGLFTNLAVQLDFTPGVAITAIRSRVEYQGREIVLGEHKPLVINGYRFYVTRNVGFAAEFAWQDGQPNSRNALSMGTIHFPPYMFNSFSQATTWLPPGGEQELWLMLQPEQDLLAGDQAAELTPPENHKLIIRQGEQRFSLSPGNTMKLASGELTYIRLRSFMGFKVHYDPYKAYLLATSLLCVLFLSWFYWQKFMARSWLASEPD
jgi:cytochrome c biogenesis protein